MRPLPAPPNPRPQPTRTASAQRSDIGPSSGVIKRGSTQQDSRFLAHYQDWQQQIRRLARQLGIVRFSAGITADTISRVVPRVEERDEHGDWIESTDPRLVGIFDEYHNPRQSPAELVRLHAWYYQTVGEMVQTTRDTPEMNAEWALWSAAAVEWDKPSKDEVLVKYVPDGRVNDETAFAVPRRQATRFWLPDEEWQAYATSPMAASVDDLRRLRSLTRHAQRSAESQLAMNDLVWMPDDDWTADDKPDEDDLDVGSPSGTMEQMWAQLTRLRFMDDDDITSIAPHLVHWGYQYGPPQTISVGDPFDPNGIAYRDEARQDFARGTNLPASLVVGGGPGDANHWTEWLVDKKFFDSAIAPVADRIFHVDLTSTFLAPRLRLANYEVRRYRIGYDAAPVIVEADQSSSAIPAWLAGLLGPEAALELMNIDPDKKPTPEELDQLFAILAKQKQGSSPFAKITMSKAGPSTVAKQPPPGGPPGSNGNTAPPTPTAVAAVLGQALLAMAGRSDDD